MRTLRKAASVAAVATALCAGSSSAAAQPGPRSSDDAGSRRGVIWWVVGSGGTLASPGGSEYSATVGQTAIDRSQAPLVSVTLGFWIPAVAPVSEVVRPEHDESAGNALSLRNYPNPFHGTTVISFRLQAAGHVRLRIFNIMGDLVRTLVDEPRSEGEHSITWDGRSDTGTDVTSATYIYTIETDAGGDPQEQGTAARSTMIRVR